MLLVEEAEMDGVTCDVVAGGVGGLAAAALVGRQGRRVTLLQPREDARPRRDLAKGRLHVNQGPLHARYACGA